MEDYDYTRVDHMPAPASIIPLSLMDGLRTSILRPNLRLSMLRKTCSLLNICYACKPIGAKAIMSRLGQVTYTGLSPRRRRSCSMLIICYHRN